MTRTLILAGIAAASLLTPALAQRGDDDRTRIVRYGDLDLSTQSDVRKLDRRIATAVADVCGPTSDADPAGKNRARRCRFETRIGLTAERRRAIASAAPSDIVVAERER